MPVICQSYIAVSSLPVSGTKTPTDLEHQFPDNMTSLPIFLKAFPRPMALNTILLVIY